MTQPDQVFSPSFPTTSSHNNPCQSELSQNRKRAYFIGKQFNHYYHAKFKKISSKKYLSAFNSPAFYLGFIWFFYRKMYVYGSLSLVLTVLVGVVFEFLDIFAVISFVTILALSGLCANPIYKAFVDQKISKVEDTQDAFLAFELKQQGGVSRIAATVATILLVFLVGLWRIL